MKQILYVICFPALAGFFAYLINRLRNELNFTGFFLTLFFSIELFIVTRTSTIAYTMSIFPGISFRFYLDGFSGAMVLFNSVVVFLIWFYSLRAMLKTPRERVYYLYIAIILSVANAIVVSGNLLMLLLVLVIMAFLIYRILLINKTEKPLAARRALLINGLAVLLIMLGTALLFVTHGEALNLPFEPRIGFDNPLSVISFMLISVGALVLAGAILSQIWTTEAAKVAPASTMALVPSSMCNLIGIYLLIRVCYYVYDLSSSMTLKLVIMTIGSVTALAAVIKAVVQDEAMKLLSHHTVAQVGLMVLGIGTGGPVGIAAGMFHMINNVISKTGLFLSVGSIEFRAKTTRLGELDGISPRMPFTAASFIITALAMSDMAPLNGFYSKWMLYRAVMDLSGKTVLWPVFLLIIISCSILAVVSIMKMVFSFFLGKGSRRTDRLCETRFEMVTTTLIFTLACVAFGVLVHQIPLDKIIYPATPPVPQKFSFGSSITATIMVTAGFLIGLIVLILGEILKRQPLPALVKTAISVGKNRGNDVGAKCVSLK